LLRLASESFEAAFLSPAEKHRMLDDFHAAAKSACLL
jgi:hypothetical protein